MSVREDVEAALLNSEGNPHAEIVAAFTGVCKFALNEGEDLSDAELIQMFNDGLVAARKENS